MDMPHIAGPDPQYVAAATTLYLLDLETQADMRRKLHPYDRRARAYRRAQAKRVARRIIHAR